MTSLLTHPDMPWIAVAAEMIEGRSVRDPLRADPAQPGRSPRQRAVPRLLGQIKEQVDIVLVDTPPVLAVSDPLVVSTATSGVVLVCRANRTRVEALQRAAMVSGNGAAGGDRAQPAGQTRRRVVLLLLGLLRAGRTGWIGRRRQDASDVAARLVGSRPRDPVRSDRPLILSKHKTNDRPMRRPVDGLNRQKIRPGDGLRETRDPCRPDAKSR